MQYLTKDAPDSFIVRLSGPEEEQKESSNLAENIFNTPIRDSYAGRVITFKSNKQFKNFLFWKLIFANHTMGNKFSFMRSARWAANEVRNILNKDVICVDELA